MARRVYGWFWACMWDARARKWWKLEARWPGFESGGFTAADRARRAEIRAAAYRALARD